VKTKTELITSRENNDGRNVQYEHTIKTDSILIDIGNNSHCNDRTDRTYVHIDTMYGDVISINQVAGWISVNGTVIALKGKASK